MTTGQDKIAQYLHEAHAMELALVRTLQAHSAMTPAGEYRSALDRHRRDTQRHADAVARRLRELGRSPGIAETAYGLGQRLVGQALSLARAPLDMLRGSGGEEKLLKNAKDECATEALEIATYDALEALARQVGDDDTAALAAELRADEERMLETLRAQLPRLTAAVTGAELPAAEVAPDQLRAVAAEPARPAQRRPNRSARRRRSAARARARAAS